MHPNPLLVGCSCQQDDQKYKKPDWSLSSFVKNLLDDKGKVFKDSGIQKCVVQGGCAVEQILRFAKDQLNFLPLRVCDLVDCRLDELGFGESVAVTVEEVSRVRLHSGLNPFINIFVYNLDGSVLRVHCTEEYGPQSFFIESHSPCINTHAALEHGVGASLHRFPPATDKDVKLSFDHFSNFWSYELKRYSLSTFAHVIHELKLQEGEETDITDDAGLGAQFPWWLFMAHNWSQFHVYEGITRATVVIHGSIARVTVTHSSGHTHAVQFHVHALE